MCGLVHYRGSLVDEVQLVRSRTGDCLAISLDYGVDSLAFQDVRHIRTSIQAYPSSYPQHKLNNVPPRQIIILGGRKSIAR